MVTYFLISKKPIFIANQRYIFDRYKNIKYYWQDIEEIVATDHFLQLKLYSPSKYINQAGNPLVNMVMMIKYSALKLKTTFDIDLDLLDIKIGEHEKFIGSLNGLSLAE